MWMKEKILDQIEKTGMKPTSANYFTMRKYAQIGLLALLVLIGIFMTMLFFTDFGENMRYFNMWYFHFPLIWIFLILGIGFFAFKDFQNTGKWYKYPIGWIIGGIFLLFLIIWFLGFRFGIGHNMNSYMGSHMRGYRDFTLGQQMWQDPDEGRMGGIIQSMTGGIMTVKNFRGDEFKVSLSGAILPEDIEVWDRIRIIGQKTGTGEFVATEIVDGFDMWPGMMWGRWDRGERWGRGMMEWR